MKPALCLALALLPTPLLADTVFSELVGSWRGNGTYTEGITQVDLRCRMSITGDSAAITLAGRCASSLGGDDFTMHFEQGPNRTASVRSGGSSRASGASLDGLTGPLGRNGVVLKGVSQSEEVTVQLLLQDDGGLVFATREVGGGVTSTSYVTLARQ